MEKTYIKMNDLNRTILNLHCLKEKGALIYLDGDYIRIKFTPTDSYGLIEYRNFDTRDKDYQMLIDLLTSAEDNKQIQKIRDAYESNREVINAMRENGIYSNAEIATSFEAGYDSALHFVLSILENKANKEE